MYVNLRKEMLKRKIHYKDIAALLKQHKDRVQKKVTGYNTGFYVNEAIKIHKKLFPDVNFEYLFRFKKLHKWIEDKPK